MVVPVIGIGYALGSGAGDDRSFCTVGCGNPVMRGLTSRYGYNNVRGTRDTGYAARDRKSANCNDIPERKDERCEFAAKILCNATGTVQGSCDLATRTLAECSHSNRQRVFQMEGGSQSLSQQATVTFPYGEAPEHWATKTSRFKDA